MPRHFSSAPWSTVLKLTSALGAIALLAAGFVSYRVIPLAAGFTHQVGLGIALALFSILIAGLVFMVTGYTVTDSGLHVERLLWSTRVPLAGLTRVWFEPDTCQNSIRVFGNGGLFAFTGLYHHPTLGRYRLFATNFSQTVVLVFRQRVVVVTPDDPQAFINYLCRLFPAAHARPHDDVTSLNIVTRPTQHIRPPDAGPS
ncbi:MAG: PH domain-containing protein [Sulfuricaulis sp.]